MSDFVVSARKYRPQTFSSVVGQSGITETLKNAIKEKQLPQALLFCGPRGVGKTTCARILAKNINKNSEEENDFAFNIFELDAASNNSVDDIRNLIDQVRIPPQTGSYKVYIIDEVHMLSANAFNAFLKTLEEPPKHAIFILATTEKHKIIPTILSRCQIFDFKRIQIKDIAEHLANISSKENITADPDALFLIAQKADGALRDALSIFDQMVTFSGNKITYQSVVENLNILDYQWYFDITNSTIKEDIPESLIHFHNILDKGFDSHNFLIGLSDHFRNLLLCKDERSVELLEVSENVKKKYLQQSKSIENQVLLRSLAIINKSDVEFKLSKNQRLLVEFTLMQLCSLHQEAEKKKA